MKITSKQKKVAAPLIVFIVSSAAYVTALGSGWFILPVIPMAVSLSYIAMSLGPPVVKFMSDWLERDGWH